MVDINLFKEDEEEQEWPSGPEDSENNETESEDVFDDDLGFDDTLDGDVEPEMEEVSEQDEEDFLDDDETVPEFEDEDDDFDVDEDVDEDLDYDYGEAKDKKAPVWLWIVLVLVVLGACFYLFIYPKLVPSISTDIPRQSDVQVTKDQPVAKPDSTKTIESTSTDKPVQQGNQVQGTSQLKQPRSATPIQTKSSTAAIVSVSHSIFENLAKQNQFGAVLISDNQFMIQYASETAGVSQAMGHRIKALIGINDIKVSPEDRNVKGNRVRYEGVISGTLPDKGYSVSNPVVKQYANASQFEQDIRGMLSQNKLKIQSIEKLSSENRGTPVRVKAEGQQENMIQFMNNLKNIQGNISLDKLFLSPSQSTDFKAQNVKIVLDLVVLNK